MPDSDGESCLIVPKYPWDLGAIIQPVSSAVPATRQYKLERIHLFTYLGVVHKVPVGFSWEASIPRMVWTVLGITPHDPLVAVAAVEHDWLYFKQLGTREQADEYFRLRLIQNGMFEDTAEKLHAAVSLLGAPYWDVDGETTSWGLAEDWENRWEEISV